MLHHLKLGQRGEAIAQAYVRQFCSLRHLNWKSGKREIDIIAERNNVIYFIEVKTRSSSRYGWPEEAVDYRKQQHIQQAAANYLLQYALYPAAIRFDIIAITFKDRIKERGVDNECSEYNEHHEYELMHFKDVF
ncbi:YraN family protein [Chitinophaga sp. 30R24]|uniref:YraN family protein n=1 Tax=Chitinophaga sp. 30R24 TaxID=3248838 RepID=UPI003B91FCF6